MKKWTIFLFTCLLAVTSGTVSFAGEPRTPIPKIEKPPIEKVFSVNTVDLAIATADQEFTDIARPAMYTPGSVYEAVFSVERSITMDIYDPDKGIPVKTHRTDMSDAEKPDKISDGDNCSRLRNKNSRLRNTVFGYSRRSLNGNYPNVNAPPNITVHYQ